MIESGEDQHFQHSLHNAVWRYEALRQSLRSTTSWILNRFAPLNDIFTQDGNIDTGNIEAILIRGLDADGSDASKHLAEPSLSDEYLDMANAFSEREGINIRSVVLFGGQVKGYTTPSSDVDAIFIVDDDTDAEQIDLMRGHLEDIEEKLGIRDESENLFQETLDRIGAQYKSVFVCKEQDFVEGNVTEIFKSNSVLDSAILDNPIWATDIGLKNIILTAQVVQGEDMLEHLRTKITPVEEEDMVRNRRMYGALAMFGILAYPFTQNATKYSMSSLKWALHSSYFGSTARLDTLNEEAAYYQVNVQDGHTPETLEALIALRENYEKSFRFNVRALFAGRAVFNYAINNGEYPVELVGLTEGEQ